MGDRRPERKSPAASPVSADANAYGNGNGNGNANANMGKSIAAAKTSNAAAATGSGLSSGPGCVKGGKKKSTKERWLLTRKTWRYMADAGRKLIPDGAHNRQEDIPKIESYFQHVCRKEPRFLLWRKSSYPGALGFRSHTRSRNRNRNKGGSYREREKVCSSADEAEDLAQSMGGMTILHTGSGKFDVQRLRKEFLQGPSTSNGPSTSAGPSTSGLASTSTSAGPSTDSHEKAERPKSFLQKLTRMKSTSSSKFPAESPQEPQTPPLESDPGPESPESEDSDQKEFIDTLTRYLNQEQDLQDGHPDEPRARCNENANVNAVNYHELLNQLRLNLASEYSSQRLHQDDTDTGTGYGTGTGSERHHHGGLVSTRSNITPSGSVLFDGDHQQKVLLQTLNRYFGKTASRDKMISDLLTDRKLLDHLYSDLRRVRGSRGRSGCGSGGGSGSWMSLQPTRRAAGLSSRDRDRDRDREASNSGERETDELEEPLSWHKRLASCRGAGSGIRRTDGYVSPPPLIQVLEDAEVELAKVVTTAEFETQTEPISAAMSAALVEQLQKQAKELQKAREDEAGTISPGGTSRRRSSVDHDDVSPSVSDTIKRYLRMARKKSLDSDKADRFKRVNYDRNLRNIKPKGEITKPGDDDGLNKGSQSDESWIDAMKELKLGDIVVLEKEVEGGLTSPPKDKDKQGILSSGQSFLSNLLHGLQHHQSLQQGATGSSGGGSGGGGGSSGSGGGTAASAQVIAMHKSKSSSSVTQQGLVQQGRSLVANKIGWKTRSKSQQRNSTLPSVWTPQGRCMWSNVAGRHVTLTDTSLVELSDVEAKLLQKVAIAKLQALNMGTNVKIPSESASASHHKPKRRAYLLKRKALTTGFFDAGRNKDEKCGGFVFGIPLSQCLENDRAQMQSRASPTWSPPPPPDDVAPCTTDLRRRSQHGSRSSFSSLTDQTTHAAEEHSGTGSCESLITPAGLLDTLSCSTLDISSGGDREGAIPHIVQACLRHLEAFGLNTLGLFRISSSKKKVRQLREEIDRGKEFVMTDETCPHLVATLLKEFFRDLPDPLLCRDLYHAFVQTQRIRNRRLQQEALQHLVQLLPVPNRDTLAALVHFLCVLAQHAQDYRDSSGEWKPGNKMDSNNLATLIAPNILHNIKPGCGQELSMEGAEERIDVINVVRSMIDHNDGLFTVSAELLDEVYVHMMDSHPEALDTLLRKRDYLDEVDPCPMDRELLIESEQVPRVWSREDFLHETAAMGGPEMSMNPRHSDRGKERTSSKKRYQTESKPSKQYQLDSKSVDTSSEDLSVNVYKEESSVITASLKIPVPSAISRDPDILFIEDQPDGYTAQITIGSPRRQHRSSSDSEVTSLDATEGTTTEWPETQDSSPRQGEEAKLRKGYQRGSSVTTKELAPVILQKVTFTTTSELQQIQPKSASSSTKKVEFQPDRESERKLTSISSIGGAVMRSKTADIERMLNLQEVSVGKSSKTVMIENSSSDKKNYAKRRYTDSRHQTRHIPDASSLQSPKSSENAPTAVETVASRTTSRTGVVWKRRELIASDPK